MPCASASDSRREMAGLWNMHIFNLNGFGQIALKLTFSDSRHTCIRCGCVSVIYMDCKLLTAGPMRSFTCWMGKIGLGIVERYRKNTADIGLWIDLCPPKRCWSANPPIPANVTLDGNKSSADAQVKMTVFLLKGKICSQRHGHKNTNVRHGLPWCIQAKEHHGAPGNCQTLGQRPETNSPSQPSGGINPADTLF